MLDMQQEVLYLQEEASLQELWNACLRCLLSRHRLRAGLLGQEGEDMQDMLFSKFKETEGGE
jgi:hypothetical protein